LAHGVLLVWKAMARALPWGKRIRGLEYGRAAGNPGTLR
jgi:hypothetical protein